MPETNVTFNFQPKQEAFYDVVENGKPTFLGLGGAKGGGKSKGGRNVILLRRLTYPNTNALIFRRTYGELNKNHIRTMQQEFPSLMNEYYRVADRILELPNGSSILFDYAEHYADIQKHHGLEYTDILIDEATQLLEEEIMLLRSCNRCSSNTNITPKMILTMNPGGVGHGFCRRIFLEKKYKQGERAEDYFFQQAHGWDNIEWVRKYLTDNKISDYTYYREWTDEQRFFCFVENSPYGRTLNALDDIQRKAFLYGDWDTFAGQFFAQWDRNIHVIPDDEIDPNRVLRGGLDYGQRTVLEVLSQGYDGDVICEVECWSEHQSPRERFHAIADTLIAFKLNKLEISFDTNMNGDMSEYQEITKAPIQIAREVFDARMGENAPVMVEATKRPIEGRTYREAANEIIRDALQPRIEREIMIGGKTVKTLLPTLRFRERCEKIIDTLPKLIHQKKEGNGLDFERKGFIADPFDALKYGYLPLITPNLPEEKKEYQSEAEYMKAEVFDKIADKVFDPKVNPDIV